MRERTDGFKPAALRVLPCLLVLLGCNMYILLFIREEKDGYLLYLDVLVLTAVMLWGISSFVRDRRFRERKERELKGKGLVCRGGFRFANRDIAEHDAAVLEELLQKRFEESCELQDYVAAWCHELKIPLSASLLINEKLQDEELKRSMRCQLERIRQLLNSMLLGCRLESPLFDLQVKQAGLLPEVKTAIRGNQFFLMQKGFGLEVKVDPAVTVRTDPAWLVYVLDQLLGNAAKYTREKEEKPRIRIWSERRGRQVMLFVEDNGEGIKDCDICRIFEKGFTGSNCHNGKYKSTGLGLYMAAKIIRRMGHQIRAESRYRQYTRFCITFFENDFFSPAEEQM